MGDSADFHWGTDAVDVRERSLPGLKARFLVDHAPDTGRLLEVGCGGGKLLRTLRLHRPGLVLHGCDVREPREEPEHFAFRKVEADGALPFEDASLDVVVVFDVLEHVPEPARLLSEAARVLTPGGRLVAFVPVEGEALSLYTVWRAVLGQDTYAETKEHLQAFTHASLRGMVDARFSVAEWRYAYHALGHAMDATFFAAHKMTWLRDLFWRENAYYNAEAARSPSAASRVFNGALRAANAAAYAESSLLGSRQALSAGVLFDARRR